MIDLWKKNSLFLHIEFLTLNCYLVKIGLQNIQLQKIYLQNIQLQMCRPSGELKQKQPALDAVGQLSANEIRSFGHVTQQLGIALFPAE